MVLTSKGCLKLDILPEIWDKAKSTEDMMRKIWVMESYYQQKANENNFIALFPFSKEARYVSQLTFYNNIIILLI